MHRRMDSTTHISAVFGDCAKGALKVRFAVLMISSVASGSTDSSSTLYLVRDGQPQAVIVVQPQIPERVYKLEEFTFPGKHPRPARAIAEILQSYIERVSGATLPLVTVAPQGKPAIHVGLTAFTSTLRIPFEKYDRDVIILKRVKNDVALLGVDDYGTELAVYDFLERVCGIRWFIPGPLWEVVPKSRDVVAAKLDVLEEPAYHSRIFSGLFARKCSNETVRQSGEWQRRNRQHTRYKFHHSLCRLIKPGVYGKDHPEYYPLSGGVRAVPPPGLEHGWQPCMSNPDVHAICANAIISYFDKFPSERTFSLGVNDAPGGYCECKKCLEWNGGVRYSKYDSIGVKNYSPLYFRFVNSVCALVEKRYPDRKLGGMAYVSGTLDPPPFKLHRMYVTYIPNDRSRYLFDEDFQDRERELMRAWSGKCQTMGIYEWFLGRGFEIPRFYPHTMQVVLRDSYRANSRGFYCEAYPNWCLDGPNLWLMSKLLWNPDANVDMLIDDFCEKAFGNAKGPMRKYFAKLEDIWVNQPLLKGEVFSQYYLYRKREQLKIFQMADVVECERYLREASRLADTEMAKKRIELLRNGFRVTGYYAEREAIYERLQVDTDLDGPALAELVCNLSSMEYLTRGLKRLNASYFDRNPLGFNCGAVWHFVKMEPYYSKVAKQVVNVLISSERELRGNLDNVSPQALCNALQSRFRSLQEEITKGASVTDLGPAWSELDKRVLRVMQRVAVVPHLESAPSIDGIVGKEEWQNAEKLGSFEHPKRNGGGLAEFETAVRVGYDERGLYLAYLCTEEALGHLVQENGNRDGTIWRDDSVEFLLQPDSARDSVYYQFIVNSLGALYDSYRGDKSWNGNLKIAVGQIPKANAFTIEVAIPWQDFGSRPMPGSIWWANFCRANHKFGEPIELSSWVPVEAGFKDRSYFGPLIFKR